MTNESYSTPELLVIGEIAELTAGSTTGEPDQTDGTASTEQDASDARLKRDIRAL